MALPRRPPFPLPPFAPDWPACAAVSLAPRCLTFTCSAFIRCHGRGLSPSTLTCGPHVTLCLSVSVCLLFVVYSRGPRLLQPPARALRGLPCGRLGNISAWGTGTRAGPPLGRAACTHPRRPFWRLAGGRLGTCGSSGAACSERWQPRGPEPAPRPMRDLILGARPRFGLRVALFASSSPVAGSVAGRGGCCGGLGSWPGGGCAAVAALPRPWRGCRCPCTPTLSPCISFTASRPLSPLPICPLLPSLPWPCLCALS